MTSPYKPVWSEGTFLGPHNLQQQERHFEYLLAAHFRSVLGYPYGVLDMEINEQAIAAGYFQLTKLQVAMPDGSFGQMPWMDPAPPGRSIIDAFPTRQPTMAVYLALPLPRPGQPTFQTADQAGAAAARYLRDAATVIDETSPFNDADIEIGRLNFRIIFEGEETQGYACLQIAEISRTTSHTFALTPDFIPPLLRASASPWLVGLLRRILDVSASKIDIYSQRRRQYTKTLADFGPQSEIGVFYLLYCLNEETSVLRHTLSSHLISPEKVYLELCRYLGKLMTFSFDDQDHPRTLPTYVHDDLRGTFKPLGDRILKLLETVIPTRCVAIQLLQDKTAPTLHHGRIEDDELVRTAEFYFAISPADSKLSPTQVIPLVPQKIKLAATDMLSRMTGVATGGLILRHQSPPPGPVPQRSGFQYFAVEQAGQLWDAVRGTRTISVYMPDEFAGCRIELYAVKQA